MSTAKISIHELAKHNTANDVWIAVNGSVYGVTSYLSDHPGGDRILLAAGGSDATEAFEDVGHSEDAEEMMESMKVGSLSGWVASDEMKHAASFVAETVPKAVKTEHQSDGQLFSKKSIHRFGLVILAFISITTIVVSRPAILGSLFTLKAALASILGSSSIGGLFLLQWLQKTFLSHPELHHFPVLIENKTERKVVETKSELALDRHKYRPLKLVEKQRVGPNALRLGLVFPDQLSRSGLAVGQHISLRAVIDGKTVVRSYTPTSRPTQTGSLELTIKVYEDGLMGKYLQNAALGTPIHVRGPQGRFHYRRNMNRRLVCIAGGSGITPMFNVIQEICLDQRDETEVLLLYASRSEEDVMMKRELEALKDAGLGKLEIEYLLSRPSGGSGVEPQRLSKGYLNERLGEIEDDTKYLLCGPDGMVDAVREGLAEKDGEADVHVF